MGNVECVAGLGQWLFALQGTTLASLDLSSASLSGGCYESAFQLPAGG